MKTAEHPVSEESKLKDRVAQLSQKARLLSLALGGMEYKANEGRKADLSEIEPVALLAGELVVLVDDLEDQVANLEVKAWVPM